MELVFILLGMALDVAVFAVKAAVITACVAVTIKFWRRN